MTDSVRTSWQTRGMWKKDRQRIIRCFPVWYTLYARLLLICALLTIPSFHRFHDMVSINIKYTQCILWSLYCLLLQNHPSMDPEPWWRNNVVINSAWNCWQNWDACLCRRRCTMAKMRLSNAANRLSAYIITSYCIYIYIYIACWPQASSC